jgi:diguanylate cyclase
VADSTAALLAKATLRRLVAEQRDPSPENYAQAWRAEAAAAGVALPAATVAAGIPAELKRPLERLAQAAFDDAQAATALLADLAAGRTAAAERCIDAARSADGPALAALIEQLMRGVERSGKGWTAARKKDSVQRVLQGSRGDARRLRQRLGQLVASWEHDPVAADTAAGELAEPDTTARPTAPAPLEALVPVAPPAAVPAVAPADDRPWRQIVASLAGTLGMALPTQPGPGLELQQALDAWLGRLRDAPADAPLAAEVAAEVAVLCDQAERILAHRGHLFDQLGGLCRELTASLADLAEDDSWARGQCEAMTVTLDDGLNARGVRAVGDLLRRTRARQGRLRSEREQAREALKAMIGQMLGELGGLGETTGRFQESMGRYATTIERADSLESLAGAVREMVAESRAVHGLVQGAHDRLQAEHAKASDLSERVRTLEDELRRLSDEVATDQLTQIANRRGLLAAFEAERSRVARGAGALAIGLLDIDNFKKLNDSLGHGAGDEALKALAKAVHERLRPSDLVARYGGEEFVVLLPDTPADEGRQILTRLQRALSGSLFLHDDQPVFVTFSAGVTAYRDGEAIEAALERADQALYEAKRTGKNRTCIA